MFLKSILGHINSFGRIVEWPLERGWRRIRIHFTQDSCLFISCHSIYPLLVTSTQRPVCIDHVCVYVKCKKNIRINRRREKNKERERENISSIKVIEVKHFIRVNKSQRAKNNAQCLNHVMILCFLLFMCISPSLSPFLYIFSVRLVVRSFVYLSVSIIRSFCLRMLFTLLLLWQFVIRIITVIAIVFYGVLNYVHITFSSSVLLSPSPSTLDAMHV